MWDSLPLQLLESGLSWSEELEWALKALALLLRDEKTISAYEVNSSRLVSILLNCLVGRGGEERVEILKRTFMETAQDPPPDLNSR